MGIIFMGTPVFALPSLRLLHENGEDILSVVTQPDRPSGRGQTLAPPPVKTMALEYGLPVHQPRRIKDESFIQFLRESKAEMVVVVAFGQIIPKEILGLPRYECINLHASLLPKYRGAAPINWAIIKGEEETGVTTMLMDEGVDTGPHYLQKNIPIAKDDTAGTLSEKLARIGADLLVETIRKIRTREIEPKPQRGEPSYAPVLKKEDGLIDWKKRAVDIYNQIRGMDPWPGAYTYHKGEAWKIWKGSIIYNGIEESPGRITEITKEGIKVSTGEWSLLITEIQLENRKRMAVKEYLQGHRISAGEQLGV